MTIKDLKLGIKKLEELLSVQLKIKEMKHKKDIKSIEVVKDTKKLQHKLQRDFRGRRA